MNPFSYYCVSIGRVLSSFVCLFVFLVRGGSDGKRGARKKEKGRRYRLVLLFVKSLLGVSRKKRFYSILVRFFFERRGSILALPRFFTVHVFPPPTHSTWVERTTCTGARKRKKKRENKQMDFTNSLESVISDAKSNQYRWVKRLVYLFLNVITGKLIRCQPLDAAIPPCIHVFFSEFSRKIDSFFF
jgi:hypothetical protein